MDKLSNKPELIIASIATVLVAVMILLPLAYGQQFHSTSYSVTLDQKPHIQVITFSTEHGLLRMNLPSSIVSGERFFGTFGTPPQGDIYAVQTDFLLFAGQGVHVKDRGFTWIAPKVEEDTHVAIILQDLYSKELARADVLVVAHSPRPTPQTSSTPHFPAAVQSGNPAVLAGSFDSTGGSVSVKFGNEAAVLMTQTQRETVVLVPEHMFGATTYEVASHGNTTSGLVHCVVIRATLRNPPKRDRGAPYEIVASGLSGLQREIALTVDFKRPILYQVVLHQVPPSKTRPNDPQAMDNPHLVFIEPADVRPDGTFHAVGEVAGPQPGTAEIETRLVMPADIYEDLALLVKIPRQRWDRLEEKEHAALLRQRYGEQALLWMGEMLMQGLGSDAAMNAMLAFDFDKATPLILTAVAHHHIRADLRVFTFNQRVGPSYPYRDLLHAAAVAEFEQEPDIGSVEAIGLTGSAADLAMLEFAVNAPLHPLVHDAIEASMARLGSEPQFQNIVRRLSIVITKDHAEGVEEFQRGAKQAAFTGDTRFLPFLCRHVHDPTWSYGDYSVSPGSRAVEAIMTIQKAQPNPSADLCPQH